MIWHSPRFNPSNPYNEILSDSIENHYESVLNLRIRNVPDVKKGDIVHIHWIHNYYQNKKGGISFIKYTLMMLTLSYWRKKGVKVGWTVHNLLPHSYDSREKEIHIRSKVIEKMDFLVMHSEEVKNDFVKMYGSKFMDKINVIPHPHYRNYYREKIENTSNFISDDENLTLLFFGSVKKYKGVVELIQAVKKSTNVTIQLRILGKCEDADLEKKIKDEIENVNNIYFKNIFLEDEDLIPEIQKADFIVLPYKEITTSGSVVLAASLQKKIIGKDAPYIRSIYGSSAIYFNSIDDLVKIIDRLNIKLKRVENNTVSIKQMDPDYIGMLHANVYKKTLLGS